MTPEDEDEAARVRWYRRVLEAVETQGFAEAIQMISVPDLTECLRRSIEVSAWRSVMPQYEYRDGEIHRTLASLPPAGST